MKWGIPGSWDKKKTTKKNLGNAIIAIDFVTGNNVPMTQRELVLNNTH